MRSKSCWVCGGGGGVVCVCVCQVCVGCVGVWGVWGECVCVDVDHVCFLNFPMFLATKKAQQKHRCT